MTEHTARPSERSSVWTDLLDAMEAGLDVFPPSAIGSLPADPGPLPPPLQHRAAGLLRRMSEIEADLAAQQVEAARELIALSAARSASAATGAANVPRLLDTRA